MRFTRNKLHECFERVLKHETVTDIATQMGIVPSTLSNALKRYTVSIGKYKEYKQAIYTRSATSSSDGIAINQYDKQGNLIKSYPSFSKACRDTGLSYYKLKQLLNEGKEWKLA